MSDKQTMIRVHQQITINNQLLARNRDWIKQTIPGSLLWQCYLTYVKSSSTFAHSCKCYRKRLAITMYHKRENS